MSSDMNGVKDTTDASIASRNEREQAMVAETAGEEE